MRAADVAVAAWYGLLTLVATAPLLLDPAGRVPSVPLDPLFQATVLERMSENLLRLDLANLYEGGFFYPAERTLALSDSLIGLQPVALPLGLVLGDPVLVANILLIATFPLAALSADALARLMTGSRLAGWICGTAYAFAAYRFTHIGHLNLLQMWALPFAFLTLELVLRRGGTRAAVAWAAVHVFIAGTALNYLLMLAILEPLWLAVRLVADPGRRDAVLRLTRLVVPGAVAAGVIALLLMPYMELRAAGYERTERETFAFSARLSDYLRPADDSFVLGDITPRARTGQYERSLAPGVVVIGLAAAGVAVTALRGRGSARWWRRHAPWLALGGAALVLSLGPRLWPDTARLNGPPADYPQLPFGLLDAWLPLESLRSPARFSVFVLLAVALVAAATAARLWRTRALAGRPVVRTAATALLALVLAAEYVGQAPTVRVDQSPETAAVYEWLRRQPAGPVVELPTSEPDRWLLASTVDGHPRLNGWSGFVPKVSWDVNLSLVRDGITPEEWDSWIYEVRQLGGRYLVVHWSDISRRTRASLRRHDREGLIQPLAEFRDATVYGVGPFDARWSSDPIDAAGVTARPSPN